MADDIRIATFEAFGSMDSISDRPSWLDKGFVIAVFQTAWNSISTGEQNAIDSCFEIQEGEDYEFNEKSLEKAFIVPGNRLIFCQALLKAIQTKDEEHGYVLAKTTCPSLVYQTPVSTIVEHYFLYHSNDGRIIDLLNWALDIPTGYDYIETATDVNNSSWTKIRGNPYDPEAYASDQTPLMLWLSVRAVFLMGIERRPNESTRAYITRVFREHKLRDGSTRKEAVGRAYAISISTLQKRGYLKKGKREATKKGLEQGEYVIDNLGSDEIESRFDEFEMILNLSQGKRYANY